MRRPHRPGAQRASSEPVPAEAPDGSRHRRAPGSACAGLRGAPSGKHQTGPRGPSPSACDTLAREGRRSPAPQHQPLTGGSSVPRGGDGWGAGGERRAGTESRRPSQPAVGCGRYCSPGLRQVPEAPGWERPDPCGCPAHHPTPPRTPSQKQLGCSTTGKRGPSHPMSVPWRGKLRPGARAPATGQVRETGQDRPLPATPATSLRMGGHLPGTVRTRGGRQAGTEVTGGKLPGRCHTTRSPVSIRTTSAPVPHITSSRKSPTQAGPPLPQPPWPAWSPRLWVLPSPPTMSPRARGRARPWMSAGLGKVCTGSMQPRPRPPRRAGSWSPAKNRAQESCGHLMGAPSARRDVLQFTARTQCSRSGRTTWGGPMATTQHLGATRVATAGAWLPWAPPSPVAAGLPLGLTVRKASARLSRRVGPTSRKHHWTLRRWN